jgi:hypothetical protein
MVAKRIQSPAVNRHVTGPFCRMCGRDTTTAGGTNCPGCTNLFSLAAGQCLYSPRTGRLWFRATGNRTLVRANEPKLGRSKTRTAPTTAAPVRVPWWLVAIAAIFIYTCLQVFAG